MEVGNNFAAYFSMVDPLKAANVIRLFEAISTGMNSALYEGFMCAVLMTPLAQPTRNPIGPLILSTHPTRGSLKAGVTMLGRAIQSGRLGNSSLTSISANLFV